MARLPRLWSKASDDAARPRSAVRGKATRLSAPGAARETNGPGGEITGLSLRQNFGWMLTGNVVYALCQWAMVILLAKLTDAYMIGQFSLGLAISTPVLMFANMQLRAVQAVDSKQQYAFGDYLGLRTLTTLGGFFLIASIAYLVGNQAGTVVVILCVGAAKAIESFSDVFYGLFQSHNRLDQIGKSMIIKGVASVIALGVTLHFTRSVFWGVVALAFAWLAVLAVFDARRGWRFLLWVRARSLSTRPALRGWRNLHAQSDSHRRAQLARLALPLGIVMTLASLNMNIPRYFVQSQFGEKMLGIYSTMAYVMVAVVTVADAMGNSATPRLSQSYSGAELSTFRRLLLKLLGLTFLVGLAGLAGAALAGPQLLTILYGVEYAAYSQVFVWLMAAAGMSAVAAMLTYGITSTRCFRAQVLMFTVVTAATTLACAFLVPTLGLTGAAIGTLIGNAVHAIAATAVLTHTLCTKLGQTTAGDMIRRPVHV